MFQHRVTTPRHSDLLSTQLHCLVEHSPDDTLAAGRSGQRSFVSVVTAEVGGQQARDIQTWDLSLGAWGEALCESSPPPLPLKAPGTSMASVLLTMCG